MLLLLLTPLLNLLSTVIFLFLLTPLLNLLSRFLLPTFYLVILPLLPPTPHFPLSFCKNVPGNLMDLRPLFAHFSPTDFKHLMGIPFPRI